MNDMPLLNGFQTPDFQPLEKRNKRFLLQGILYVGEDELLNRQSWRKIQKGNSRISLGKRLANYGPRAKFSPPPIFVKKVLLEHSHAHWFVCIVYGYFCTTMAELSSCDRNSRACKTFLAFYRKSLLTSGLRESGLSKI